MSTLPTIVEKEKEERDPVGYDSRIIAGILRDILAQQILLRDQLQGAPPPHWKHIIWGLYWKVTP